MLIRADASAGHRTCIHRKFLTVDVEAVLILNEDDREVWCSPLQRLDVDRLVNPRPVITSVRLLRVSISAGLIGSGLHQICQYHPRIGSSGRTRIHTKRSQRTMHCSRWTERSLLAVPRAR